MISNTGDPWGGTIVWKHPGDEDGETITKLRAEVERYKEASFRDAIEISKYMTMVKVADDMLGELRARIAELETEVEAAETYSKALSPRIAELEGALSQLEQAAGPQCLKLPPNPLDIALVRARAVLRTELERTKVRAALAQGPQTHSTDTATLGVNDGYVDKPVVLPEHGDNHEVDFDVTPEITIIWKEYLASMGVSVAAIEFVDRLMDEVADEAYERAAKVAEAELKNASGITSRVESALCNVIAAAIRARKSRRHR